ncbi:hypothetical protein ZIOFF_001079 [Zingiber officinale]|uniref:Uncharacterized protein n=1 Tax=Zingiber officinale TaxID=94328 RepID=A0A8J5LY82_ZINOF|nr:hypothetical protein ZIOFF_001079 [Zingiber officinale]
MSSSKKGKAPKRSESNPNLNSARAEETVAGPSVFTIDGAEEDEALRFSRSLTREEVLRRRSRRLKQLALCYRRQYWALMEEVRVKHRDYYWEYGATDWNPRVSVAARYLLATKALPDFSGHLKSLQNPWIHFRMLFLLQFPRLGLVFFDSKSLHLLPQLQIHGNGNKDITDDRTFESCWGHHSVHPRPPLKCIFDVTRMSAVSNILYKVVITCISLIVTKGKSNIRLPHLIMMYALEQSDEDVAAPKLPHVYAREDYPPRGDDLLGVSGVSLGYSRPLYENGEPIICAKPILVAAVPSLCHIHLQKYHRAISQAFRKTGINMPPGRLVPKISVIVAVSVSHIQAKRREELKNSSKDTMDQKDEEIQKDMYRSDQDIYD